MNFSRAWTAYFFAVTSASFVFVLVTEASAIVANNGFETATADGFGTKILHLLGMSLLLFLVGWFHAFFTALLPFWAGIAIAKKFQISHGLFFVLGGTLTGLGLETLFILMPNLGINVPDPEPSFAQQYWTALPCFTAAGTAAGIANFLRLRF